LYRDTRADQKVGNLIAKVVAVVVEERVGSGRPDSPQVGQILLKDLRGHFRCPATSPVSVGCAGSHSAIAKGVTDELPPNLEPRDAHPSPPTIPPGRDSYGRGGVTQSRQAK
jgi:hypothetical protein